MIRLVQVNKHFKAKFRPDTPLEGTIIENIINSLDKLNKDWTEEEKDDFTKEILLQGIQLITHPFKRPIVVLNYINALIIQDALLKDLFLLPDPKKSHPSYFILNSTFNSIYFPKWPKNKYFPIALLAHKFLNVLNYELAKKTPYSSYLLSLIHVTFSTFSRKMIIT